MAPSKLTPLGESVAVTIVQRKKKTDQKARVLPFLVLIELIVCQSPNNRHSRTGTAGVQLKACSDGLMESGGEIIHGIPLSHTRQPPITNPPLLWQETVDKSVEFVVLME